jgi:4,5-dihydroxyphthalate decarboxylase
LSGDEHVEEYAAPSNVVSSPTNDLREMLLSGEVDAVIGAGTIDSPNAVPLFQDPEQADAAWFNKTHIYPISHLLVVKDEQLINNPWLAKEMFSLFKAAKDSYVEVLRSQTEAHSDDSALLQMADLVDGDPLPYEFEGARIGLETFIGFNVEQHIIPRYIDPEELFPPETLSLC